MMNNQGEQHFQKSMRGYHVEEVNSYLYGMNQKLKALSSENLTLKEEILKYQRKEDIIQQTMLKAQEVSREILEDAKEESKDMIEEAAEQSKDMMEEANEEAINIIREAKEEASRLISSAETTAQKLLQDTEMELTTYKDNLLKTYQRYEQDLILLLNDYHTLSRKYVKKIEKEFMSNLKNKLSLMEHELIEISPLTEATNKISISFDNNNKQQKEQKETHSQRQKGNENWHQKELDLIVGKKLKYDIVNYKNEVICSRGTVVTENLVETIIQKGLYGELISSIDHEGEDIFVE